MGKVPVVHYQLPPCPGFGWDRVTLHRKLGAGTARTAKPNQPTGYFIPH